MSNLSHLTSVQTFDKWSPTKLHIVPPLEKEKCNWLYKLLLLLIQKFGDLLMLTILPRQIVKPVKCEHTHTHRDGERDRQRQLWCWVEIGHRPCFCSLRLKRNIRKMSLWDAYLQSFYICIFVLLHNVGKSVSGTHFDTLLQKHY